MLVEYKRSLVETQKAERSQQTGEEFLFQPMSSEEKCWCLLLLRSKEHQFQVDISSQEAKLLLAGLLMSEQEFELPFDIV